MVKEYRVMVTQTESIMVESELPVIVNLLPQSQKNQRPGGSNPGIYAVDHENGNPNHDADDERRYFGLGAEGRQASYHFVGDSNKIIQMVPISEWTWQSGDNLGPGNTKSISFSIAQGSASFTKARKGMAFFQGKLMKKRGIARGNIRQHYDFAPNRKNCPQWIRDGGLWPSFVGDVQRAYDGGSVTPLPPTYATPVQIPALDIATGVPPAKMILDDGSLAIYVGDRVRATKNTPRLQRSGLDAAKIGPDIVKGEEFDVDWLIQTAPGQPWFYYTPWDTRVIADDVERISDAKSA